MANETLTPDGNTRNVAGAVTDDSNQEIRRLRIDDATKGLKVMIVGGVGAGTVISVSVVTANGISGSVATATTTPAITLTLGAITPSSIVASGTITGLNLSGTNTGDQTSVSGNAGTATALQNTRTIWGQNFNGTGNVTGDITVGVSSITMTGSLAATGARVTKGWFTDIESMNMPTVGGTAILSSLTAPSFTTSVTVPQVFNANNAIAASANAATVTRAFRNNVVTNNSAATLTITMSTTSAAGGDMVLVQILDFSAVAQTITWVNTENSTVTAPTTSNGSTTLPLTVGFKWNASTSKWRCIASA